MNSFILSCVLLAACIALATATAAPKVTEKEEKEVCGSDFKWYHSICEIAETTCNECTKVPVYVANRDVCVNKKSSGAVFDEFVCVKHPIEKKHFTMKGCMIVLHQCLGDPAPEILHGGKCGDCTEANICPNGPHGGKKCMDGEVFADFCVYDIYKCEQSVKGFTNFDEGEDPCPPGANVTKSLP